MCIRDSHEQRPYTLDSYKEKLWHGGTVYYEEEYPSLLFAKDGEIFDLNGKQTVVMGGAYSCLLYTSGVARTLERLSHRYKLFLVTNAQRGYIDTVFAVHDVQKYFTDWMCFGDTNASKDVTIRKIIERNNLKNAVYVGDTQGDADSCEKAGIPIVYAAYGLGKVEKPWRSIDKFSELEDIFLGDKARNEAQESISECKLSEEDGDREGCMHADMSKDVTLKSDDMSEKRCV